MTSLGRIITKEARVAQIAQKSAAEHVDGSVRVAIQNIQAQLQALHSRINEIVVGINADYDTDGTLDTAGRHAQTLLRLVNNSGGDVEQGDVVLRDTAAPKAFAVGGGTNRLDALGVVAFENPDIDEPAIRNNAEGLICSGGAALVRATGAGGPISPGDPLVTAVAAKMAMKATSPESPGIFAFALEELIAGEALIKANIVADSMVSGPAIKALRDFDFSMFQRDGCYNATYDEDGTATGFSGMLIGAEAWVNSSMSQLVGRWTYGYNASGLLSGSIHSAYGEGGEALCAISRAFEYQNGRIDRIISEIL